MNDKNEKNRPDGGAEQAAFDNKLLTMLRSDPTPAHGDRFWLDLDAALESSSHAPTIVWETDSAPLNGETSGGAIPQLMSAPGQPPRDELAYRRRRWSPARAVAAAAALVIAIAGIATIFNDSDSPRSTVVASDADASFDYRDESRARVLISPFTDLAETARSGSLDPLFTVQTETPGYWRLTALDQFVGDVWTSQGDYVDFVGPVPGFEVDGPNVETAKIEIIDNDSGGAWPWLPVAPSTLDVRMDTATDVHYLAATSSWILGDRDLAAGSIGSYEILFDPSGAQPGVTLDAERIAELLDLPDGFSETAQALATEWAGASADLLERAELIVGHLGDEFVYDPDWRPGSVPAASKIDRFLTDRVGNIEQFVGTYAAMVRAVGVPSRVAVGFTAGEAVEGDPTLYVIREEHAHAWVEIYIDGRWIQVETIRDRSGAASGTVGPIANLDHWHAIYAMYDCRSGEYLPPILSSADPVGIHSHDDGLIHIHPFFEESAGENATLQLFFDAMGVELTDEAMNLHDGTTIPAKASCGGEPAQLHVRKWQFDFTAATEGPDDVVIDDIGSIRFMNDREAYLIALAPIDGAVDAIPQELFDRLNAETGAFEPIPQELIDQLTTDTGAVPLPNVVTEETPGSS